MQDKVKIEKINNLIKELESSNVNYDGNKGLFYDYDTVTELLEKAVLIMVSTVRCLRPQNIPDDIAWCESMNLEDEFDPYVYHGDMTPEDFIRAQKHKN